LPIRPAHLVGHHASGSGAIDGHFYKREIFGCRHAGKSPVVRARRQPYSPRTTTGRLLLDRPYSLVEAASHDPIGVRLLSVSVFDPVSWSDTPPFHKSGGWFESDPAPTRSRIQLLIRTRPERKARASAASRRRLGPGVCCKPLSRERLRQRS
jgi:hypothetical protein